MASILIDREGRYAGEELDVPVIKSLEELAP
jgi:hypothetical protein